MATTTLVDKVRKDESPLLPLASFYVYQLRRSSPLCNRPPSPPRPTSTVSPSPSSSPVQTLRSNHFDRIHQFLDELKTHSEHLLSHATVLYGQATILGMARKIILGSPLTSKFTA